MISGKDLEALSDDPDELQSELQALAGPSAGPNGGQIYIDGFTGGQLPPKSSIAKSGSTRIHSPREYDRMGFGRIEILTKPGTDKYHGQFMFNDNHSGLDSPTLSRPIRQISVANVQQQLRRPSEQEIVFLVHHGAAQYQ